MRIMRNIGENAFRISITLFFILLSLSTIYPFLNALAYSFSDGIEANIRAINVLPAKFTFANYATVLSDRSILGSLQISVARTLLGVLIHLTVVGLAAYAISKRFLIFRRGWLLYFIIPIYISGGLLPYFVVVRYLGLMNSFLVYIIPPAFSAFELLVMKTYFESLPESIEESALIDGAGAFAIFTRIVVPISAPIIATIVVFHGVWQWNSWFDAMLFVSNTKKHPLQMMLQRILLENQADAMRKASLAGRMRTNVTSTTIQMTTLIISTVPILCIYPFLQKYFVKGIMIGAVKG